MLGTVNNAVQLHLATHPNTYVTNQMCHIQHTGHCIT